MKTAVKQSLIITSVILGMSSAALACDGKKEQANKAKEVRTQASDDAGTSEVQQTEREKKGFKPLFQTRDYVGMKGQ